jgi:hypothetical protein
LRGLAKAVRAVRVLLEAVVNSKKENSKDFCPNYVQEFSLLLY